MNAVCVVLTAFVAGYEGLHDGFCAVTHEGADGDCSTDNKGLFRLPPGSFQRWSVVRQRCAARCRACERCNFVSFSLLHRDCSWYRRCSVASLRLDVSGFKTVQVVSGNESHIPLPSQPHPKDAPAAETDISSLYSSAFYPSPRFLSVPPLEELERGYNKHHPCPTYRGAHVCGVEWDVWLIVDALVRPRHTVIEFGARFGTTSCRLARAVGNSGNVVSVEPDDDVFGFLLSNRDAHTCNFHAVGGTVSDTPMALGRPAQYARQTRAIDASTEADQALPNLQLAEIERRIGSRFNAAVIDCEGCIHHVLTDGLLQQLELLIIEEDAPSPTLSYVAVHRRLRRAGFVQVWRSRDTFDPEHQAWSANMRYSAWQRGAKETIAADLCQQHKTRANLTSEQLNCAPARHSSLRPSTR